MPAIAAVVDENVADRLGQMGGPAVVHVIAGALPGEQGVEAVVEVVRPHAIQPIAAAVRRTDQPDVVLVALGDDVDGPAGAGGLLLDRLLNVREDVADAEVVDRLHGVEAKAVDVEVADPRAGVVNEERAHRVAFRTVKIDRVSPRRVVAVGEVRAELAEVVSFRAEVIVDNVEDDRQAVAMGGIDQTLERPRPAVAVMHGVGMHAVVAPVALGRETEQRA